MKLVIEINDGELSRAVATQVEAAISKLSAAEITQHIQTIVGKKVDRIAADEVEKLVQRFVNEEVQKALKDQYGYKTLQQYAQEQIVIAARNLVKGGGN